jgi:hypothetical protein
MVALMIVLCVAGKKNGKGCLSFPGNFEYDGDYLNDNKTGFGTQRWANGNKYVGSWKVLSVSLCESGSFV